MNTERKSTEDVFYGAPAKPDATDGAGTTASGGEGGEQKPGAASGGGDPANDGDQPKEPTKSNEAVLFGEKETVIRDFEPSLGYDVDQLAAGLMLEPNERTALLQETGEIFRALGVGADEAQPFMGLYRQAILKPPSNDEDLQWRDEGMAAVNAKYGHEEAHRRLTKVNEFLRQPGNETLRRELVESRLGNHPKVIAAFLERADQLKVKPAAK